MVGAVRPVLHQVGDEHDQEQRDEERQLLDPGADAVLRSPAEQLVDEQVGREQDEAHDQVVDEEMVEVGLPLGAKDRLVLAQGEQLLDEDEDQRRAEQVEDEPVEADVGRAVGEVVDRHLVPAERERQADQHEGGEREPAGAAHDDVEERRRAREHERPEQQQPHRVDVVGLAQLRRRQVFGEVKGEDAEEDRARPASARRPPRPCPCPAAAGRAIRSAGSACRCASRSCASHAPRHRRRPRRNYCARQASATRRAGGSPNSIPRRSPA